MGGANVVLDNCDVRWGAASVRAPWETAAESQNEFAIQNVEKHVHV